MENKLTDEEIIQELIAKGLDQQSANNLIANLETTIEQNPKEEKKVDGLFRMILQEKKYNTVKKKLRIKIV